MTFVLQVAERYREFFISLINAVANLRAAKGRLRHQLDDMGARCDGQVRSDQARGAEG